MSGDELKAICEELESFQIASNSTMAVTIAVAYEKAQRMNRDEGRFSLENFVGLMLDKGTKAFVNYLDADDLRRETAAYIKAKANVPNPPPFDAGDPKTITAHVAYSQAIDALDRKYHQGGYKVAL